MKPNTESSPIVLEGLEVAYGREAVLKGLDLEIPRHAIFALLGANGAGKSTALFTLVNALRPRRGTARVLGCASADLGPKELARIGFVAESQELPGWLTAAELANFCRPFYPDWDDGFCRKLADMLDLPMNLQISKMSRGQRMKAALLVSMAYRPELLILDEPFSGLDPLVRYELIGALLEFVGEHDWTVLLSSHDVEEVERLCDRVGFLVNGRIQENGSMDDLLMKFRRVRTFFARPLNPLAWPADWSDLKVDGNTVEFVTGKYDPDTFEHELKAVGGEVRELEVFPMPLREVFVAIARRNKSELKEMV